ncbi:MAG: type I-E CRISPR-associated endonuclease Cas1e [Bacteroidetes bacterium]|nr:type I-E CRISPR-associated endonuclease Cas1e [Bacteroidota bacterium]
MLPHTLRDLPKVRDSISFLYVERCRVEQTNLGVELVRAHSRALVPVASLSSLLLGPGTTVTHGAVTTLTKAGCSLVWVGEAAVRCYAHGHGETHAAHRLARQAVLSSDPALRLAVVERMYRTRFREPLPEGMTLQQIRGHEGARVRAAYAQAAARYGVAWSGRNYNRTEWDAADPLNRALSCANACLHGLVHAALVSAGYSPALGFIHAGKQLAFVYDVADLYKMTVTVPLAFATVAEGNAAGLEQRVRRRCRDAFRSVGLLSRLLPDVARLLDLDRETPERFDPDDDPTLPAPWWSPRSQPGEAPDDAAPSDWGTHLPVPVTVETERVLRRLVEAHPETGPVDAAPLPSEAPPAGESLDLP